MADLQDPALARLMTATEVSEYLAVSRSTVYRMMARGDLSACKIGGIRRITLLSILEMVSRYNGGAVTMTLPVDHEAEHELDRLIARSGYNDREATRLEEDDG